MIVDTGAYDKSKYGSIPTVKSKTETKYFISENPISQRSFML